MPELVNVDNLDSLNKALQQINDKINCLTDNYANLTGLIENQLANMQPAQPPEPTPAEEPSEEDVLLGWLGCGKIKDK